MNFKPDKLPIPLDAWEVLSPTLSAARQQKMRKIAAKRTAQVRLVLQDVQNPHNISACLRSAEAFGISHVDIVSSRVSFKASTVAKGVAAWLQLSLYPSIVACAEELLSQGYGIYLGMPQQEGVSPLAELSLERPMAVVFGNEQNGVSPEWLNCSDGSFTIPMHGFVESLNISVCAAITLHELSSRGRKSLAPERYFISAAQQKLLLDRWVWQQRPSAPAEYQRLISSS
jgi:tRNA (guanosine-2'-O-)-methyltransferase